VERAGPGFAARRQAHHRSGRPPPNLATLHWIQPGGGGGGAPE
jgi:hypothetical protein